MKTPFLLLLLALLIIPALGLTDAKTQYWLQVGAWGDNASRNNKRAQAEIRTKLQSVRQPDTTDAFWVGDNLQNGAFIQFGYEIEPGNHCIKGQFLGGKNTCTAGSRQFSSSETHWFWQYWPDGHEADYYYASGPAGSVGTDGSWHTYTIIPNVADSWDFVLDGQAVDYVPFTWVQSKDVVFVAAEKVTSSSNPGPLGPAEFRNIAYLKTDGWHQVNSLYVLRGCGYNSTCVPDIPYGVQTMGPNHIIAGTGASKLQPGKLLWGMLTLSIIAPPNAYVLLDSVGRTIADKDVCVQGSQIVTGCIQTTLQPGWHAVTVNQLMQINSNTRLRFSAWDDGSTSPSISRYMDSDVTLQASYVTQYLVASDSGFSSNNQVWYNKGTTASLSISQGIERPMEGPLGVLGGKWVFSGWYEDGSFVTTPRTVSFLVDGPHTLVAQWQPNVVTPILILGVLACAAALAIWLLYRRSKVPDHKEPSRMFCINCGAELPLASEFCNKCGSAQQ